MRRSDFDFVVSGRGVSDTAVTVFPSNRAALRRACQYASITSRARSSHAMDALADPNAVQGPPGPTGYRLGRPSLQWNGHVPRGIVGRWLPVQVPRVQRHV